MKENELPEEKLLKVIRNKNLEDKIDTKAGNNTGFLFKTLLKVSFLFRAKILLAFFLILFVFFTILLVKEVFVATDNNIYSLETTDIDDKIILEDDIETANLAVYLDEIEQIDIFNIGRMKSIEKSEAKVALADIVLLGVITEEPIQAILKDKKTDSTSFLQVGERFGGLVVQEIYEGVVILESNGQIYELRM